MKSIPFAVCLLVWVCGGFTETAGAAPASWEPARTWVFVVGVLEWQDPEMFGSFPVKNRRDGELVGLLKERGVPAAQIVYLQDRQATQQRIETAFIAQLKKVKAGDLLFVYYAGHGYKPEKGSDVYLASYDAGAEDVPGWSVKSIPRMIEKHSAASQVLWLIDCCYSGRAAAEVKGRTKGPGYICVTSSLASQSSTGHWTFTESFLDALRGAAYVDLNHDGQITIGEFALHAEQDMRLAEEQQSAFATAGDFNAHLVIGPAKPLTHPRMGERVEVKSEGKWYVARVVEAKGAEFKVHYIGYEEDEDVWVKEAAMRPIRPKQYAVGTKVEVLWKKVWYPATVLKVQEAVHYIHYTDYEDDWDEWVSSKRIRVKKGK